MHVFSVSDGPDRRLTHPLNIRVIEFKYWA